MAYIVCHFFVSIFYIYSFFLIYDIIFKIVGEIMDIEKYANSKVFIFFEWAFKLIVWNLIAISIIVLIAGTPMYFFFNSREKKEVNNITYVDENKITVELKNSDSIDISDYFDYGEITDFEISSDLGTITFLVGNRIIVIGNVDRTNIKNIKELYFEDKILKVKTNLDNIYDLGDIYNSTISIEKSKLDSSNRLVLVLENGTQINYGNVFNYNSTLDGILVFISILLALFAFIPTYSTIFSMIKIYGENGHSGTFVLFFDRLWDNFKSLWILELIIIPFISLIAFGIYMYYSIIQTGNDNFFLTISYDLLLVCLGICIIYILNIPMTVGYFKMKLKSLLIFTFRMTFRNFLYSLLYLVLIAIPIILMFLTNFFIPIWFLLGFSLPLFGDYFLINKKYRHMVNVLNVNENEELQNVEEENE